MAEIETPRNCTLGPEPELHLLLHNQTLDEPLWKSLFRNIDEFFFPKKLPPLVLTSKPVPVRDIWGFYNYKRRERVWINRRSTCWRWPLIIAGTYLGQKMVKQIVKPKETVVLIAPDDLPDSASLRRPVRGGGGGGGDRDKLQASQGRLPKQSMQQITPPMAVVRNLTSEASGRSDDRGSSASSLAAAQPARPGRSAFASAFGAVERNRLGRRHWLR